MSVLSAAISGLIQGFTEFLPISSSGHLSLFHGIFGGGADFTFDVLLHLATLAAVFCVYRRDIQTLLAACCSLTSKIVRRRIGKEPLTSGERYACTLMLATLPMAGALVLEDRVKALFSEVRFVGLMLLVNAAVLFLCDRITHRVFRTPDRLTAFRAIGIGCFQLCAVVPGLSRSGMTVTGGRMAGLDRESAVRMSFLMSIPVILCANVGEIPNLLGSPAMASELPSIAVGMLCAFVSGILSMKLLSFLAKENRSFRIFSLYCAVVGILAVIFG